MFLISLKAGGQGLNLTAADYVFILDPWWNPAVEAQAVDRAHRIGQDRHVFAYRLIARDTVEEKILAVAGSQARFGQSHRLGRERPAARSDRGGFTTAIELSRLRSGGSAAAVNERGLPHRQNSRPAASASVKKRPSCQATAVRTVPIVHSTARVKGGCAAGSIYLWCFPFFLPQKNQKNRGICSEIGQKKLVGHLGE